VGKDEFSGGQCSRTAEKFGASGDAPSRIFRRMNSALKKKKKNSSSTTG
jgi:hypothetical protein